LTLETIENVATAINEKQDLINDNDLSISKTFNLQSSFNDLQDNTNLKQNIINDVDLTLARTDGLVLALEGKQATISTETDLNINSITTISLEVNGIVNMDTHIFFDTIMIRRPTGITGEPGKFYLAFRELHCWVNGSNLLQSTSTTKTAMFADFLNKELDLGSFYPTSPAISIYNNNFDIEYDTHSRETNSDEKFF
jgi:hypothetical protein